MRRIISLAAVAILAFAACTGATLTPSPSGAPPGAATDASAPAGMVLNRAPADLGCDSIGWPEDVALFRSLTFRIDPAAAEPVSAVSDTGRELQTFWVPGFEPGSVTERVVRDPDGQVVARDGEVLDVPPTVAPELHGYPVCLTPTTLHVMLEEPGG